MSATKGAAPTGATREEVTRCLTAIWPLLLAASSAADGPDPTDAAGHLRAAAELLLACAAHLN